MKIICTLGLLVTWLLIAFFLGLAAGVRIAVSEFPAPHPSVAAAAEPPTYGF